MKLPTSFKVISDHWVSSLTIFAMEWSWPLRNLMVPRQRRPFHHHNSEALVLLPASYLLGASPFGMGHREHPTQTHHIIALQLRWRLHCPGVIILSSHFIMRHRRWPQRQPVLSSIAPSLPSSDLNSMEGKSMAPLQCGRKTTGCVVKIFWAGSSLGEHFAGYMKTS